ncbi:MAG TPA: hypothetical protein PLJ62_06845 [Thermoflexales bacterium]|nr:hypothetical protein [Thermoflexales bacterium]HQW35547.1 hypothetical protein [Thermoflexales bacterium]HQZ21579.1 hypothetical protein [Thermoflexales bacterium]HQZ99894.1 hypothetical protein [Thermoflexales bacterium]
MMRYTISAKIFALGAVATFLAACGSQPAPTSAPVAPQPTAILPTAVPPTATAAPPTATAVPPTATPIPPTATTAPKTGGMISDVIERMSKETPYRMEITMTAKGMPASAGIGDAPVIFAKGEVNGKNSHMQMGGVIFALFTGDPEKPMEMLTIGDDTYVKGPAPLFGAPDSKWYTMTGGSSSVVSNPAAGIFGEKGDNQVKDSDFTKSGSETVDGKKCDIYLGNKDALQKAYDGLGTSGEDAAKIEAGEYKIWICDDGYLHKLSMTLKTDFTGNGIMMDMLIVAHMYDFGANIKIERPANPQAAKEPSFDALMATPTPKK